MLVLLFKCYPLMVQGAGARSICGGSPVVESPRLQFWGGTRFWKGTVL